MSLGWPGNASGSPRKSWRKCLGNDIGSWQGFMSPRLHSEGLGSLPRLGCQGKWTEPLNRQTEEQKKQENGGAVR
ncbi:hypothetical protein L3Q82_005119 [Scortum barcoo]|uniref:Uncharacterized protein n=1 Tax=Scortum barcoo TaxID=214431 RepID=A0ACB8VEC3_9TELE|nr:hypothetical protein L3Q82_005119 [Scortum barcoo]